MATGDIPGDMPLHHACSEKNSDLLSELLNMYHHDPNQTDVLGLTPLHIAASSGDETCVNILLKDAVDIHIRDNYGFTPLYYAVTSRNPNVIKMLLEKGADINLPGFEGTTCLHRAAGFDTDEILGLLISHGAEVDVVDEDNRTPLHYAVNSRKPCVASVRRLVAAGADYSVADRHHCSPMDYAVKLDHKEIQQLFKSHKAKQSADSAANRSFKDRMMSTLKDSLQTIGEKKWIPRRKSSADTDHQYESEQKVALFTH
eukprot:GILK01013598.1.p1 GENE.GILK01013598.1~~GILK01013598.1.p1  ORF type:complete len:258 (-),score=41.92 GILK01013598.1:152-925(-)